MAWEKVTGDEDGGAQAKREELRLGQTQNGEKVGFNGFVSAGGSALRFYRRVRLDQLEAVTQCLKAGKTAPIGSLHSRHLPLVPLFTLVASFSLFCLLQDEQDQQRPLGLHPGR